MLYAAAQTKVILNASAIRESNTEVSFKASIPLNIGIENKATH